MWQSLIFLVFVGMRITNHRFMVKALSDNLPLSNTEGDDILVVVAVDGTLAAISRDSGKLLWKQSPQSDDGTSGTSFSSATSSSSSASSSSTLGRLQPNKWMSPNSNDASAILRPLLSTTTTTQSAATSDYAAVPSMDGNVYLTTEASSMTVSTSVKQLVQRAPFLDPQGRFYVGSRHSTVAAIDLNTGQILSVVASSLKTSTTTTTTTTTKKDLEVEERPILWLGRVDYSVTVQDARTGIRNVQFGVSEITTVEELHSKQPVHQEQLLPDGTLQRDDDIATSRHRLVSTPSGNVGLLDSFSGKVMWVAQEQFQTPIAYAINSSTGQVMIVDIVPDVKVPSSNDMEYLCREMERQVELMDAAYHRNEENSDQTIVGRLEASGQLYALPLGRRKRMTPSSLPLSSSNHAAAIASTVKQKAVPKLTGGRTHLSQHTEEMRKPCHPTSSQFPSCLVDHHKHQPPRLEYFAKGHDNRFLSEGLPPPESKHELALIKARQEQSTPLVYHPDLGYVHPNVLRPKSRSSTILKILGSWLPPTIALIFVLSFELGRRKRLQDEKTETSKEVKNESTKSEGTSKEDSKESTEIAATSLSSDPTFGQSLAQKQQQSHQEPQHAIQVSDEVLGYGGQGTVVYRGILDGRAVAVKRMLKAYHASADREIRLLIESDGHPNVVRYFLKEVRGDFVYLALELCDLSLHDLIGVLRNGTEALPRPATPIAATKIVLQHIASGVRHLHSLRIVHRDLKPANILLAVSKNGKKSENSSTFQKFLGGFYIAKISDMGLGKQILGQSSLGASMMATPSFQGTKGGTSSVGVGPGSVGWQAPEVMALRWVASDVSARSGESNTPNPEASPVDPFSPNPRTSRSVDIFSLGCIFYATLVPGHHPFGEWYEREANIVHNRLMIESLEKISTDAFHLVRAMLSRDPKRRPTAKHICEHPFFWTAQKKLSFLCEFSDRLETDATLSTTIQLISSLTVERGAVEVVGTSWDENLDEPLISNMQRFRTYDPSSVRDLLRLIRNKHHHFDELPDDFRNSKVANHDALLEYFERRFPRLMMHCWECCRLALTSTDPLMVKYDIPEPFTSTDVGHRVPASSSTSESVLLQSINHGSPDGESQELNDSSIICNVRAELDDTAIPDIKKCVSIRDEGRRTLMKYEVTTSASSDPLFRDISLEIEGSADVIAWVGSTTAKELNCRGWNRTDTEWARRIDPIFRRKDPNLKRALDDPKFRTRLCNHWDESMGTCCPMRKKNKCIFAHSPVELRVKEGKKNRWGKLVDKNGDNKNPKHSGGEDTYGAARSIEVTRKEEGKWNTGKGKLKKSGSNKTRRDSP